ncbi:fungal-specific transcription factor domain-containing protein [Dichomitus squalens]|uniref:Fungal-specific transcription factor domain-containing protein n=1 Tax=Dichomitus squalens TaxID=114155 RepID=A0A4Q9PB37_9APHY|nr:fungal-specific transcription factor domain-containing protein [Dichomitus squalens]TBU65431.1 fungal-specific transcription factor domain-containing protein [Dichomitus squalens]
MPPPHFTLPASLSSPSSHGSETVGTPPNDVISLTSNGNGKRPASSNSVDSHNKRARQDNDEEAQSPSTEKGDEAKAKPTRGARACTVCRRLKMKCVGAENGPPCKRCQTGNHECIFEESNRGKRSTKKHEILTRSLRKMERTLDTVLRSLGNPTLAAGILSRSPSPSLQTQNTQALINSPSPPPSPERRHQHASSSFSGPPTSPKMHSLPDNALNPLGLLAEASLANRRSQASSKSASGDASNERVGVASDVYFKPGPMTLLPLRRLYIERQIQPEMLSFVSTEEVVALFKIYFDHLNVQASFLDPDFHTPSLVCSRSPFLLTSICAAASRFYEGRPELHTKLSELARKLAFQVPARGYKSVEIVQAYLINVLWGCGPVQRYEQDQTWMLLGMAIRMATDLNLHRRSAAASPDTAEGRARDREVRNRERTWIICFCLDRSFSAQMGKPYSIKEDYMIRNALQWARSPGSISSDSALAGYADLQRILTRSLDLLYSGTANSSGLQTDCDFLLVIKTMETQLLAWHHEWVTLGKIAGENEYTIQYRMLIANFYFHYAMLTINAFGLQNALERSAVDIGHFFARCHSSAVSCAAILRDEMGPMGYLKYAPDSTFVMGSYAVLSLLKLIRPEFQAFLDHEQKTIAIVTDIANTFDRVAVGPMHTPALYSCFLRALINSRTDGSGNQDGQQAADGDMAHSDLQLSSGSSFASQHAHVNGHAATLSGDALENYAYTGEMGPVADISTFPPTMAPTSAGMDMSMLSMESILTSEFWDSVLVPGSSNSVESLSGGFVYGAGGSGFITPRLWMSPLPSAVGSPVRQAQHHQHHSQEPRADLALDGPLDGQQPSATQVGA